MPAAPITATRNLSRGDCPANTSGPLDTLAIAATPAAAAERWRNVRREKRLDMIANSFQRGLPACSVTGCVAAHNYPS